MDFSVMRSGSSRAPERPAGLDWIVGNWRTGAQAGDIMSWSMPVAGLASSAYGYVMYPGLGNARSTQEYTAIVRLWSQTDINLRLSLFEDCLADTWDYRKQPD